MKRFELFEYDKETEQLELNEIKLLDLAKKAFARIGSFISRLRFGKSVTISLTPGVLKESLHEKREAAGVLNPLGSGGFQAYGFYAEYIAVQTLAHKMWKKGFNIPLADRKEADKIVSEWEDKMADALKKGTLDKQNHSRRVAAAKIQGEELASRTFQELTESAESYFTEYKLHRKKQRSKRPVLSVGAAGRRANEMKDTVDLQVVMYPETKMEEILKISLKATQDVNVGGNIGTKHTTKGTDTDPAGFLSRMFYPDNRSDAGRMTSMINSEDFVEKCKEIGIDISKSMKIRMSVEAEAQEQIRTLIESGKEITTEKKNSIKKKVRESNADAIADEQQRLWIEVFEKATQSSDYKDRFKNEVLRTLDLTRNSAKLISAAWNAESGQIATFVKKGKELDKFFDMSEKSISDFDITTIKTAKAIKIHIEYKGVELYDLETIIKGGRKGGGSIQFEGTAGNRIISKQSVHASGQIVRDSDLQARIDEIAEPWNRMMTYAKKEGWTNNNGELEGFSREIVATVLDQVIKGDSPEKAFQRYAGDARVGANREDDPKDFLDRSADIKAQQEKEKESIANLKREKGQYGAKLLSVEKAMSNRRRKMDDMITVLGSLPQTQEVKNVTSDYKKLVDEMEKIQDDFEALKDIFDDMDSLDKADYEQVKSDANDLGRRSDDVIKTANKIVDGKTIKGLTNRAEQEFNRPNDLFSDATAQPRSQRNLQRFKTFASIHPSFQVKGFDPRGAKKAKEQIQKVINNNKLDTEGLSKEAAQSLVKKLGAMPIGQITLSNVKKELLDIL